MVIMRRRRRSYRFILSPQGSKQTLKPRSYLEVGKQHGSGDPAQGAESLSHVADDVAVFGNLLGSSFKQGVGHL